MKEEEEEGVKEEEEGGRGNLHKTMQDKFCSVKIII